MRLSILLGTLFRLLLAPAVISTLLLYLYPAVYSCAFPAATAPAAACLDSNQTPAGLASFRLLALGDPQLEGDTSLPHPNAPLFPTWRGVRERWNDGDWPGLRSALNKLVKRDVVKVLEGYRKKIDLWGNDLYLAHIYRSVSWWTQPTHTVVLGDLLGSQWIGEGEFYRRAERFWGIVFARGEQVPRSITNRGTKEDWKEVLGRDGSWRRRIISVPGNHDIGYAGDASGQRIERFEDAFGGVNWDIRFSLERNNTPSEPPTGLDCSSQADPELHIMILNSMNLDSPALSPDLQRESRNFLDTQLHASASASRTTGTILLTHIPFHKEPGICVDAPYFSYFPDNQGGGIKEQNHLSPETSRHIMHGLTREGMGRSVVLNGHDHEGCDTVHHRKQSPPASDDSGEAELSWTAVPSGPALTRNLSNDSLREITVRSMMGSFSGNAGLLSAWWDDCAQSWQYEYDVCVLGVQHIWWAVHVLDLVVVGLAVASLTAEIVEAFAFGVRNGPRNHGKEKRA